MMMTPDVDGYTKTLNHRKYSKNCRKSRTWKPKQY